MRLLITGALSLSGTEFARGLVAAGHDLHVAVRSSELDYDGSRGQRLAELGRLGTIHTNVPHGTQALASLISQISPDALLMHAHPMTGFRSADYDLFGAADEMTRMLPAELDALAATTGAAVIYSGSYYEPSAGMGTLRTPAVSPYGLSKTVVYESLRMHAATRGVGVYKFVIPNPYGPGEEGRLGNHLADVWRSGGTPVIRTPRYLRDNIPMAELVVRYVDYVAAGSARAAELRPSGYIETQGNFVGRVAREVGTRIGRELPVDYLFDAPHDEPMAILNDGSHSPGFADHEQSYWDAYARQFS
jgi:UDP-glucose 4-epimerase